MKTSPNNRRTTGASGRSKLDPLRPRYAVLRQLQLKGFALYPCPPGAKHGYQGWADGASRNEAVLELFGPDDGTMAHMGLSDMLAIDLDRHPGGADGVENFKNFARTSDLRWPATRVHVTSGDGRHVFYRQNPACPIRTSHGRLAGGVDIKAGVALVRMPPTPGYRPLSANSVAMIPLANAREIARLTMTEPKRARIDGVTGTKAHSLGGLMMTLANAQQGTRNDVLHWCLCRAAEMPARKQRSVLRALRHEAHMIGLGDWEIEKTIASVFGGRRG